MSRRRSLSRFLLLLFLTLVFAALVWQVAQRTGLMQTVIDTPDIRLNCHRADKTALTPPLAGQFVRFGGIARTYTGAFFRQELPPVTITACSGDYARAQTRLGERAALSLPPARILIQNYVAPVLVHEFVHLHQAQARPQTYRADDWDWFDEGVANHLASPGNLLRIAATAQHHARTDSAAGVRAMLAARSDDLPSYRCAASVVAFLEETCGTDAVRELALWPGHDRFAVALQQRCGLTEDALFDRWAVWAAAGGTERFYRAHAQRYLDLARQLYDTGTLPADGSVPLLTVHFHHSLPEIDALIDAWNARLSDTTNIASSISNHTSS